MGNYLNILYKGDFVKLPVEEIFDEHKYQHLRAATFVSSPHFVFDTFSNFETIDLILGIEDTVFLKSFQLGLEKSLNPERITETWESFDNETKNKIVDNKYNIFYPLKNKPIHSKIYLLEGQDEYRVVIGSANLTNKAFTGNQFEELLVFDEPEMYQLYLQRFNFLKESSVDYIYEKLKQQWKEQNVEKEKVIYFTGDKNEFLFELQKEGIEELKVIEKVITEDERKDLITAMDQEKEQNEKEKEISLILNEVTRKKPKANARIFKTDVEIDKIKNKILSLQHTTNRNSHDNDPRIPLYYDEFNKRIVQQETVDERKIGKPVSSNEIDKGALISNIRGIHKFIEGYETFTVNTDLLNQKRVYEAILYSLTAPYLFKIRNEYVLQKGRESERSAVSPFLMIGGRARSGKSVALEFCNYLLFNKRTIIDYAEIDKYLYDYLQSNNVSPIFVDEIPKSFFQSKSEKKGERLFKTYTNSRKGAHSAFIGTTNASGYAVNQQSSRRIYYLEISNPFLEEKRGQSADLLDQVYKMCNNSLFKHFMYKLETQEISIDANDILLMSRNIMTEIYDELNIEKPSFFPNEMFDDYRNKGKTTWRTYFKNKNEFFRLSHEENRIYVDEALFMQNKGSREISIEYLPSEVLIEESTVLILNKTNFMLFIEEENYTKAKRSGFFNKLFKGQKTALRR
ncbi:phospholipase D family protein [Priestia megaterium]|uniref:Phospholipase D family protein n=1 Tax=Priestia megaterium TaxID=1404 RepID=A0AAX6BTD7_PRIMG|nr:phospholipase D family protein [Priestia megaterium]GMG76994.1 phospholipase D family protein [Priestia megaterium]